MKNSRVLLIKNLPFFIPLLLSIVIFWNPNFLVPNTYFNIGDTVFPLKPELYLKISSSLWSFHNGLGLPNRWPVFLPLAGCVYILHLLKIPLWVINRLWLVIPTAMVGWCTYYLFRSLFKEKYAFICGIVAGIFAIFLPYQEICTLLYLAFAGFPLILGSLIRGLDSDNIVRYSFIGALGILLTTLYPRYFYLTVLLIFIYLPSYFLIRKDKVSVKSFKFLFIFSVMTILINAFWLIPTIISFSSTLLSSQQIYSLAPKGYDTGLMLFKQYKDWANLLYVSRLVTSNVNHPLTYLMRIPIISFLSFLMPIYAFSSFLIIKKKSFWALTPCILFLFLLAIAPAYNVIYKIYLFLWQHLPGFFIFKAPVFFITFLGIFYAILTGATTLALLNRIDTSQFLKSHSVKKAIKVSLVSLLLALICFVYGGGLLIGYTPKKNVWGHIIYGNHLPAAKIPEEYFELGKYLSNEENIQKGYRVLSLPYPGGGYARYNWWIYCSMPDILLSTSYIPVVGASFAPRGKLQEDLMKEINRNNLKGTIHLMRLLNIRYVILHKDYLPIKYVFDEALKRTSQYLKLFAECENLEVIKDNQYFEVYKVNAKGNK